MPTPADRAGRFGLFITRVLKTYSQDGWTVADIEKATGVSKSTIYRWASGKATVEPRTSQVWDFCEGLGIPIDTAFGLLGWTKKPSIELEPPMARIHQFLADPEVDEGLKHGIREAQRGLANVVDRLRNMETV